MIALICIMVLCVLAILLVPRRKGQTGAAHQLADMAHQRAVDAMESERLSRCAEDRLRRLESESIVTNRSLRAIARSARYDARGRCWVVREDDLMANKGQKAAEALMRGDL